MVTDIFSFSNSVSRHSFSRSIRLIRTVVCVVKRLTDEILLISEALFGNKLFKVGLHFNPDVSMSFSEAVISLFVNLFPNNKFYTERVCRWQF